MLNWELIGEDKEKVYTTGNAAHNLTALYETGKQTVEGRLDRINNIYDLEGNGLEWTMEANGVTLRAWRGGSYLAEDNNSPGYWNNNGPQYKGKGVHCSRSILYIK